MIEIHGPFQPEHRVTMDGYHVPYIDVTPHADGTVSVGVDRRFGMPGPVPREELDRWLPILANAMAIAAGFSCHGENCTPLNPFKVQMAQLGSLPPNLSVIDGGKPDDIG